jgi:hypothetical protein
VIVPERHGMEKTESHVGKACLLDFDKRWSDPNNPRTWILECVRAGGEEHYVQIFRTISPIGSLLSLRSSLVGKAQSMADLVESVGAHHMKSGKEGNMDEESVVRGNEAKGTNKGCR